MINYTSDPELSFGQNNYNNNSVLKICETPPCSSSINDRCHQMSGMVVGKPSNDKSSYLSFTILLHGPQDERSTASEVTIFTHNLQAGGRQLGPNIIAHYQPYFYSLSLHLAWIQCSQRRSLLRPLKNTEPLLEYNRHYRVTIAHTNGQLLLYIDGELYREYQIIVASLPLQLFNGTFVIGNINGVVHDVDLISNSNDATSDGDGDRVSACTSARVGHIKAHRHEHARTDVRRSNPHPCMESNINSNYVNANVNLNSNADSNRNANVKANSNRNGKSNANVNDNANINSNSISNNNTNTNFRTRPLIGGELSETKTDDILTLSSDHVKFNITKNKTKPETTNDNDAASLVDIAFDEVDLYDLDDLEASQQYNDLVEQELKIIDETHRSSSKTSANSSPTQCRWFRYLIIGILSLVLIYLFVRLLLIIFGSGSVVAASQRGGGGGGGVIGALSGGALSTGVRALGLTQTGLAKLSAPRVSVTPRL